MYRLYSGENSKIVLNSAWVHECVRSGTLLAFNSNYGGYKVFGDE
jgi:hypothetical protein